ncbi:MAG: phosphoribosylanthranilate isomerase [Rickettsiales bacterium]
MKIKLCGFNDINSLECAIENSCDFLGFVFVKNSVRNINYEQANIFAKFIPKKISKVAVVVNASIDEIEKINNSLQPDFFQFHGEENLQYIHGFKEKYPNIKIIKAFSIQDNKDLESIEIFKNAVDYFLFDNKSPGSGNKFDWDLLKNISSQKPWFLSGGINIDNIEDALKKTNARFFDISSGIEKIRGQKSPELIKNLMEKFNSLKNQL